MGVQVLMKKLTIKEQEQLIRGFFGIILSIGSFFLANMLVIWRVFFVFLGTMCVLMSLAMIGFVFYKRIEEVTSE
jgi:hypothetical protein